MILYLAVKIYMSLLCSAIMISMCLKVQSDRRPPFLKIVRGLEKVLIDQDCEDVEVDEGTTIFR